MYGPFGQYNQEGIKCTKSKEQPRSYCPNVYTVMRTPGNVHYDRRGRGMNKVKKKHTKCLIFPEISIVPFFGENKTKKYNWNLKVSLSHYFSICKKKKEKKESSTYFWWMFNIGSSPTPIPTGNTKYTLWLFWVPFGASIENPFEPHIPTGITNHVTRNFHSFARGHTINILLIWAT